jgi:hypothetical protein
MARATDGCERLSRKRNRRDKLQTQDGIEPLASFDAVSAREEGRHWFTQLLARGVGSGAFPADLAPARGPGRSIEPDTPADLDRRSAVHGRRHVFDQHPRQSRRRRQACPGSRAQRQRSAVFQHSTHNSSSPGLATQVGLIRLARPNSGKLEFGGPSSSQGMPRPRPCARGAAASFCIIWPTPRGPQRCRVLRSFRGCRHIGRMAGRLDAWPRRALGRCGHCRRGMPLAERSSRV